MVGYDLTFTAPKSVSVLWALGDDATRATVHGAHRAAVASVLEFVEATVVRTRVGAGGCRQVRTRGMIAAGFEHWDTRTTDPNLHTHVVLANKVQGPDGAWRALDGKTVHAAVVTVSELYDVLLADELARRLPVAWGMRERGERRNPAFEIDGVGDDLLTAFSTRADQIHCAEQDWATGFAATHGRAPSRVETTRARQHLARATRPPKTIHRLSDLFADWANRARALTGLEPRDLAARALHGTYGRALHAHDVGPEVREALATGAVAQVSTRRSVWTTWNLGAEALRASKLLRMASPTDRLALLNAITTDAAALCVHLDDTRDPDRRRVGENLYTTVELLAAEKTLIDATETTGFPYRPARDVHNQTAEQHLGALVPDQRAAVEAIITSGHLLDAMVGPAGSGKTTTLAALVSYWQQWVGPVIGLAPSAAAAHTLAGSIGAPCETTAKWIYESVGDGAQRRGVRYGALDQALRAVPSYPRQQVIHQEMCALRVEQDRWRATRGQLIIIDEASLADTRTMSTITEQARAGTAKVLLVGDHLQRGSIDAGGAFGLLARRGPTAELTSLWRFTHPWEARASLELRRAHPAALDAYAEHGAFTAGTRDDMLDAALDAVATARANGSTAVLQAAENRTVLELNARAHATRVRAETASSDGVLLHDGLTAGIGDRIVARRNNRHLPTPDGYVRNGSLWDITRVLPGGSLLARPAPTTADQPVTGTRPDNSARPVDGARSGDRGTVHLPADYVAEHVELGYATTTARTQGITVDQTHTIAAPGMAHEDLYVAMSRGRDLNRTYVVLDDPDPDCLPGNPNPPSARDVLEQILATSHTESTATETWEIHHPDQPAPVPPARPQRRASVLSALNPMSLAPASSPDAPVISM
ncbi:multifunctional conjugation protein TraI [mine drainage metagenome]|uniref:Multifunctional conjugation protein TraI n=1 Tax=mine drainage metagenome TaxID=410659 RepID=A0A1J5R2B0_9ZZZZ